MSISKQNKNSEVARTKKYYEQHARSWSAAKTNSFHHESEFRDLVSRLPKKGAVIDIGCAGGVHVPMFLGIGRNLSYHGIDIANSFLKIARSRYPQLVFKRGDIANTKTLPKKKFDGFIAVAVLMHLPLPLWNTAFTNIEKIVKPRGYGYITLPIAHPSGKDANSDSRHFTIMKEKEQISYLKSRSWKIIKKYEKLGSNRTNVWRAYLVQIP